MLVYSHDKINISNHRPPNDTESKKKRPNWLLPYFYIEKTIRKSKSLTPVRYAINIHIYIKQVREIV